MFLCTLCVCFLCPLTRFFSLSLILSNLIVRCLDVTLFTSLGLDIQWLICGVYSSYQSCKILSLFFKCFFCPHTTSENLITHMLGHWKLPNNSLMLFSFFILGVFIYMPSSFPTMSNLLLILPSICFISDIIVFNYQSFIWVFVVLPCHNFLIYELQI